MSDVDQRMADACHAMNDALYCGCRCTVEHRVVEGHVEWGYGWDAACPLHSGAPRRVCECGHHEVPS